MSSTTTRLGLYKPEDDGSENVDVATDINDNWDNLDAKMGARPVTSGTMPGAPAYTGEMVHQTDTGRVYVGVGVLWKQIYTATSASALTSILGVQDATVNTNEARGNSAYGDCATVGPTVSIVTGTRALVIVSAEMHSGSADEEIWTSYAVSGATTIAATDNVGLRVQSATTFDGYRASALSLPTLTAGTNTFTMKYRTDGTSAQFQRRNLIVVGIS